MNMPPKDPAQLHHKSVLVDEVIAYLNPQPGKTYLDCTFGGGGHTRAILEAEKKCTVIAMDWDHVTLDTRGAPLKEEYGDRLQLVWGNLSLLYKILKNERIGTVDGILADFGPSQIQIFGRPGFSMFVDTPLDMRMSPGYQQMTAETVVSKSSEEKLREIFWQLGEEPYAKEIARAIVSERQKHRGNRIRTTGQLVAIIEKAVPAHRRKRIHPATKVFQALRIYINHELDNIASFLPAAIKGLNPDGRLVCISFHSLEDRMVKNFFKEQEKEEVVSILTPKVVEATEQEIALNPSSRSAKLRAVQKL
jgi:16S rRNA (cytosine1402-N4)-methyltransferase